MIRGVVAPRRGGERTQAVTDWVVRVAFARRRAGLRDLRQLVDRVVRIVLRWRAG